MLGIETKTQVSLVIDQAYIVLRSMLLDSSFSMISASFSLFVITIDVIEDII